MGAKAYRVITRCRICGNPDLVSLLHLGEQALTGVFPRSRTQKVTAGPVELVKCREGKDPDACGLVQLRQSYDKREMYGMDYGYRSGLNQSMVRHLRAKVARIVELARPGKDDLVIDIGSNDSTLLQAYPADGPELVGIDPTGAKFGKYYPAHIRLLPDFFSAQLVRREFGERRAKVVTSIAMFYDLDAPLEFMREVASILADDGVWVLEQSYLPAMLKATAYDTICHEHLEYYALRQIAWMAGRAGLKIVGVELNDVNGGSFSITLAKPGFARGDAAAVKRLLAAERRLGLHTLKPYAAFKSRVLEHRKKLRAFLAQVAKRKQTLLGYGASTKGNVILQYCGITAEQMPAIAEVNEDKFGCFTPATRIPIVSEADARARKPDFLMVLPWHFRAGIVLREKDYLAGGGRLVFPLPRLAVVKK
ncbi:MAG: class I SAM-dependent methyltransferase [Elusimicrobia bacterium]|nr:class I SAM-dependent methyltransferase [Elusimicrobiota bacterium]